MNGPEIQQVLSILDDGNSDVSTQRISENCLIYSFLIVFI